MTKTLLKADLVLTLDEEDNIYAPGFILLSNDRISGVGAQQDLSGRDFDDVIEMGSSLLMPGLVNAHTHTPMVLFRGLAEGISLFTMDGFINCLRRLENAADSSMVAAAVEVSCAEMIRTGTTCFADQYFYMKDIFPVVQKSGLRAALAYGIVELGDEVSRDREIASTLDFLENTQDDPRITGWVGPHAFFVDNSEEIIKLELGLAERFNTGLHIHFATSSEEQDYCLEKYGTGAITQMKKLGVLDYPMIAAHCITIPKDDFGTLAQYAFTAVICPSSSMRSGFPAAPLKAMRAAGINTALGSDNVANANSYDLFNEMQIAAKLMVYREQQPGAIPAREVVEMATMGGARALGLEDKIGSLEIGKQADIIALKRDEIGWGPHGAQDIFTALVYSISGMHVTDVMVDGRWLYRNSDWTTLDHKMAGMKMDSDYLELERRLIEKEQ